MKAIVVRQPFAALIVLGQKVVETRKQDSNYRGPLAIVASAIFPAEAQALCWQEPFKSALGLTGRGKLPAVSAWTGAILGSVDLIGTTRTDDLLPLVTILAATGAEQLPLVTTNGMLMIRKQEFLFGDYRRGRQGWLLENPIPCKRPVTVDVRPGVFDIPDEIVYGAQ